MHTKTFLRTLLILTVVIFNIGCDQVTKEIVRQRVGQNEIISLVSNHLTVTNVENSGAFLSLGNSLPAPVKNIFLSLLPAIAIVLALAYAITHRRIHTLMLIGFCCIIGGGIGNIFDRIAYGSVTDFLHIRLGLFQTGIFNMADVSIMTGSLLVIASQILKPKSPQLT